MWISKRPNGKYIARERYIDPMTGKQRILSITIDKDTKAARNAAKEALDAKFEESLLPTVEDITLSDLIEEYRADQKISVSQSTYQRNYFAMESVKKILGPDVLMSRITAAYIRKRFIDSGKKPGTLNEHLVRLKSVIRWGYKNDLLPDISYLDKIEAFKVPPHREAIKDKYLESAELKALLSGMAVDLWRLLTEFLALSGLRIGEAIALEDADVDMKGKHIHVTKAYDSVNRKVSNAKSLCSIRDVYIQPELAAVIRKIRKLMLERALKIGKRPTLFMFSDNGDHIEYYAYNKYLRENTLAIVGRSLTPHALRHTHASLLMESGVSIDVISRRLGHENSRITREIYLHVTKKLKEKDDQAIKKTKLL